MDTKSLSYKTLKNSSYSFLGFVLPILLTIIVTPIVVKKVGVTDYGVFLLLNTISSFLSLLDLGLSQAVVKYTSEYNAQGEYEKLERLLGSAKTLYVAVGLVGLLACIVLALWYLPIFQIGVESQAHMQIVFLLSGLTFFVTSQNYVYNVLPSALQRLDIVNKLNLVNVVLLNIATLVLVYLGYKLKAIMALNLVATIVLSLIYRVICRRLLPQIKIKYIWIKEELKKALKFGSLAAVSLFSTYALAYLDRIIIPIFSGTAALSFYSLPGNVALKIPGVTNSLTAMVFPLSSALSAEGDKQRTADIYQKIIRNISVIGAALTISICVFSYKILYFWLGQEFADKGWLILIILAVTNYFLALYNLLHGFILGLGKVKTLVKFSVSMAIINLLVLVILVPSFNILGAAWAYLVSVLPVIIMVFWLEKVLEIKNSVKFYITLYSKILFVSTIYGLVSYYGLLRVVNSLPSLIIVGPVSIGMFLLLYTSLGFVESEDMKVFKSFALIIKNKLLNFKFN